MTDAIETTLAAWRQREADLQQRMHGPGVVPAEQWGGRSGLALLEAMLNGEVPYPPINRTLSYTLVEVSPGGAVFQGHPLSEHYNPMGGVHGGWIATLLDSAVACAIHTALPLGKAYTTIELKVNYVKALTDRVPLVRAVAQVIHVGGRVGTAEGKLIGPDGTLYAHASTTCLIFDAR